LCATPNVVPTAMCAGGSGGDAAVPAGGDGVVVAAVTVAVAALGHPVAAAAVATPAPAPAILVVRSRNAYVLGRLVKRHTPERFFSPTTASPSTDWLESADLASTGQ
jgi:hypothetical protein